MNPCILSTRGVTPKGYSRIHVPGVGNVQAHRWAWEKAFGPIPEGKEICHHCDVRNCIELTHLFLGTHQENVADAKKKGKMKGSKHNATKTHCKNGHEFTLENTRIRSDGVSRDCRECDCIRSRKRRELLEGLV